MRGPRGRPAAGRQLTREDKRTVLRRLIKADALEGFLARNFPSAKRFGLEGAEALIPGEFILVFVSGMGNQTDAVFC